MRITRFVITLALAAGSIAAQTITPPTFKLPTYIAGGVAYNQLGTPQINGWISAIAPVSSSVGVYESTTADIIPVTRVDPATKRNVYTFSASIREGAHKTLYTSPTFMLMAGGDAGVSTSQSATGLSLGLSGSLTITAVYQFNAHWAAIVPVRGMYSSALGGWNLIPEIGIVWKP